MDYNAIQIFLTEKNLHFFTLYRKADKPVKNVIRHPPGNISAENIIECTHAHTYICKRILLQCKEHEKGKVVPVLN
jgi:hypothetical protein